MSSILTDEAVPITSWNHNRISPTFLSRNLVGTWALTLKEPVPPKHYGAVQGNNTTNSLLKSNLRKNDEFILPPPRCSEMHLKKEDNHFVLESPYSVIISRNEMFPRNRVENDSPLAANDYRLKTPLSATTRSALAGVVKRRYDVSSHARDYQPPCPERTEQENRHQGKATNACENDEKQIPKKPNSHEYPGLWPCWPAGNTHIISDITGQIVEKRDIRSLDDLKDYRIYKLTLDEKKKARVARDPATSFKSYADSDYVPAFNVDPYGGGPGRMGNANCDSEVPIGVRQHVSTTTDGILRSCRKQYLWKHRQSPRFMPGSRGDHYQHQPPPRSQSPGKTSQNDPNSFPHEQRAEQLKTYRNDLDVDLAMEQRWAEHAKKLRLMERLTENVTTATKVDPLSESMEVLSVGDEDDAETSKDEKHVQFDEKASEPKILKEKEPTSLPHYYNAPYFTFVKPRSETDVKASATQSSDNAGRKTLTSLQLDRNLDTVGNLIKTATEAEEERQRAFEHKHSKIQPFKPFLLDPTKDPTSSFYKSPLKLPPEPLWEALQYNGDCIAHRLGMQFKTTAWKRFHAIHPETVPDKRELHPTWRKSSFFGCHAMIMR